MEDKIVEEFNEKFASVEEALQYIADSQAKSEFAYKRSVVQHDIEIARIRVLQEETQRHLNHISKVLRFNIEEYEFQEDKLTKAGEILSRRRKK